MSLMNILNNTGPRTVPWGTPNTTGVQSENIWKNMDKNHADDNPRITWSKLLGERGAVSTRILQEIYSYRTDVAFFFSMTNFRDIHAEELERNICWLSVVCSFPLLMIEILNGKTKKVSKRLSVRKISTNMNVLVNIPVPAQRRTF